MGQMARKHRDVFSVGFNLKQSKNAGNLLQSRVRRLDPGLIMQDVAEGLRETSTLHICLVLIGDLL